MSGFLLRWWIFLFGIKFYESKFLPVSAEVVRSEFLTVKDQVVKFLFFHEVYEDKVYKRGKFTSLKSHAFVVQAIFDDRITYPVIKFNRTRYLFRSQFFPWCNDQVIADILLSIYLDFIRTEI